MLTYYKDTDNHYKIRTVENTSTDITLSLQNMSTLQNTTASLSGVSVINSYESLLGFTASISGAISGDEYRATILVSGSDSPIWNGSIQVFVSQSENKPEYVNQIPLEDSGSYPYKSHTSQNQYIILT